MRRHADAQPNPARDKATPAGGETIETFAGRLTWNEGRPTLSWEADGTPRTATPDRAHISPSLRDARAGDTPVSFELGGADPIQIRKSGDKWRVLVSVLGGTPAVITETLQELLRRSPPFVPDRIVVLTTTTGERGLDDRFDQSLRALCVEHRVAAPDYRPVELLRDVAGNPLSDIRSDSDNIAAANVIANRVRALTRYPENVLHASVAGGRKTMGTLLSDAMSLFGRGADAVSHVLVQPAEVELFARNFYYRPQVPFALLDRDNQPVRDRSGRALTSADVSLDLANKPFFRLRGLVDEPLLTDRRNPIDFAEVTAAVNVMVNRPKLIVHSPASGEIEIDGFRRVKLDPTHYALFRVAAEAATGALAGVRGDGTLTPGDFQLRSSTDELPEDEAALRAGLRPAALRYVDVLRRLRYPGETWQAFRHSEFWEESRTPRGATSGSGLAIWRLTDYEKARGYLNPILSRINDRLADGLGFNALVRLYGIDRQGRAPLRFRPACGPTLLELRD